MNWNLSDVKTLADKTIIVTGGNSGLGYESVKMFASKDAEIIMASRSIERGNQAVEEIKKDFPNANITVMELDLADRESIAKFSDSFLKKYKKLNILLNNAGIMTVPYGVTKDGLEQQTGVNHFGHFLLTSLLFDVIKNTPSSRIVNVSSIAHRGGTMNFDNLLYQDGVGYNKVKAYSRSKLENLLFTYELDRLVQKAGYDIKVLVAHPGVAKTNLGRHIKDSKMDGFIKHFQKYFSHEAKFGALPQVRACLDESAKSGDFYGPKGLMGFKGAPKLAKSNRKSKNKTLANRLWVYSEQVWDIQFEV